MKLTVGMLPSTIFLSPSMILPNPAAGGLQAPLRVWTEFGRQTPLQFATEKNKHVTVFAP